MANRKRCRRSSCPPSRPAACTITLFAPILAIGLVVDDAFVVAENVRRVKEEHPELSAKEPVACRPGITGQLHRQFALTIAASFIISGINSLTPSPALCGLLVAANQDPTPQAVFSTYCAEVPHLGAHHARSRQHHPLRPVHVRPGQRSAGGRSAPPCSAAWWRLR
ncbi:efflux RND transporter permease subunit [Azospirillum humicireducens]|uniref:efflux RND transporter permease subunit n=1 Tax=Azospirillum humicireducens TaxID=1226968 RepID=UPI0030025495